MGDARRERQSKRGVSADTAIIYASDYLNN
jgi:hypothetical protein